MSDPVLARLRHLMKIVDPADGHDDGKVDKSKAMEYIHALCKKVEGKCPEEHAFLLQIADAVQAIKGDSFNSAEGPALVIEPLLRLKLEKTKRGKALLEVKHVPHPCPDVDYELPGQAPQHPAHLNANKKRERH